MSRLDSRRLAPSRRGASLVLLTALICGLSTAGRGAAAPPRLEPTAPAKPQADVVGLPAWPQTMGVDTIWIAEWDFDGTTGCDAQGWEEVDLWIQNDGQLYWSLDTGFDGTGNIVGTAAVVRDEDPCWPQGDGYCNDWYQGIRIEYTGDSFLSFDYLVDSEPGYDFLQVEVDSACASYGRVDYTAYPARSSRTYRSVVFSADSLDTQGHVDGLMLPDFGEPTTTHCVYIAFVSDPIISPCDGEFPTQIGAATVIDHVELTGGTLLYQDFEGPLDPSMTFVNMHDDQPFGTWARLIRDPQDTQPCDENTTCAWIWSDDTTPTLASDPDQAYGPGGYVVRNWLDDAIVSPWVSLASTPGALATLVVYERFGGNPFNQSRIVHQLTARSKGPEPDACLSSWASASFASLSFTSWGTYFRNVTQQIDAGAEWIQVRHRVTDWQYIAGATPPAPHSPGPGPYIDRTRIGRVVATGPSIEIGLVCTGVSLAQDRFASEPNPVFPPGSGDRFRPSTDRFGTADFSMASQIDRFPQDLLIGDSITVRVGDRRGTGGFNGVDLYGAIVAGPHTGKAPPPWTPGAGGFFEVPATLISQGGNPLEAGYFVDLDDDYFRGGDVLVYFWLVEDALGAVTSLPLGLTGVPASVTAAEEATGGLLEVSFLPRINWSPDYLARIAADAHGKLEPTPAELAASVQANRILYFQMVNPLRRTGDANRTSFMYTLDRLGYDGHYDVYDHIGPGGCAYVHNHLGGRATVEQAMGYGLIVHDVGQTRYLVLPDGRDYMEGKEVDQASWYQDWLSQGATSEAGYATLWLLGENVLEEQLGFGRPTPPHPLYTDYLGVDLVGESQTTSVSPDVLGKESFTFFTPDGPSPTDFTDDVHRLQGGCPDPRSFDAMTATGTAVATHRYRSAESGMLGSAALVMNTDATTGWSTIVQSHSWFDIHDAASGPPPGGMGSTRTALAAKILAAALPAQDQQSPDPTDAGDEADRNPDGTVPLRTVLHGNVPNPFNPTTTIHFDLATDGPVALHIYNVAGRHVRTLVRGDLPRGRHAVTWDGLDARGQRVGSGLFVARLVAPGSEQSRKMILLQ